MILVVYLMRRNPTQDAAGAIFGASQPTVSRRWDLLRPVIGAVLAEFVPGFKQIGAFGTVCPTWDWRHDAHAACGFKDLLAGLPQVADLGYVGVEGVELVPYKRAPKTELNDMQTEFNRELSRIRAAVEHAVAKFKSWRMLSEEGGRFRCPLDKYESMLAAIVGLYFFRIYT